jgi:ribokinase
VLGGGESRVGPGGKGANQAVAARRAGAEVIFLTAVGADDLGHRALEGYRREGIKVDHARVVPEVASGVALIFVGEGGENMIGVAPGANALLEPKDIERLPDSVFEPGGVLLASLEVPPETVMSGLWRAKEAGMTTVLNPAPVHEKFFQEMNSDFLIMDVYTPPPLIDILTPNSEEATALARVLPVSPRDFVQLVHDLHMSFNVADVVLTRGAEGCLISRYGGLNYRIAAYPAETVDTVGAGDVFNGALAAALAEGRSLLDAASWACAAGALAVTRPGAQEAAPTRDEIDRLARAHERAAVLIT